jgi:transposase InsO family protein
MSKARLVITAVVTEGRPQGEAARAYGVSQGWVSRLVARYRAEGEAAFEPRSRRPGTSPNAIADATVDLIIELRKDLAGQGLDAGPDTICWHMEHHHQVRVSAATVSRYLVRHGLVTPEPRKRPKSSYIRFQADQPNECWQSDFTHYRLADRTDTEVLTWLDDHSRYALSVTAHQPVTGPVVVASFRAATARHGVPASTLTDNGMVYTTRFAGGRGGRNGLENELRRLGVRQKNGKANHPQTQGKVERFQQTLKKWLTAQQPQPADLPQLQTLPGAFTSYYNNHRPHRSLPRRQTPATAYAAQPKAAPRDRAADTHDRVRADRIDANGKISLRHAGRLHHIGIGRTHARTRVLLLVHDLHIRVINAATGELLRELTLDPARNYQPTGRPPGPRPEHPENGKTPDPDRGFGVIPMSREITQRWRWDLNPRKGCPFTRFRGVRPRPLGDSTAAEPTRLTDSTYRVSQCSPVPPGASRCFARY